MSQASYCILLVWSLAKSYLLFLCSPSLFNTILRCSYIFYYLSWEMSIRDPNLQIHPVKGRGPNGVKPRGAYSAVGATRLYGGNAALRGTLRPNLQIYE